MGSANSPVQCELYVEIRAKMWVCLIHSQKYGEVLVRPSRVSSIQTGRSGLKTLLAIGTSAPKAEQQRRPKQP